MCKMELTDAVERLYDCLCDVYVNSEATDNDSIIIKHKRVKMYEALKCRISYKNGSRKLLTTKQTKIEGKVSQSIKLFVSPEYDIKPGSEIIVFKDNKKLKFKHSGISSIYKSHQEIILEYISEA